MKPVEWKTYRTRFLVKAKQLNSALSFTDHLGRQHCGRKGDYLVESSDGVLSIAPRQIFEDIYVSMPCMKSEVSEENAALDDVESLTEEILHLKQFHMEPLQIERIEKPKFRPCAALAPMESENSPRGRRKSPQPLRPPRAPSHLTLM